MRILKLTCTIFMIAGCFRPQSWTSLFKRTIYNVYRLYVISMLYAFTLSQVIDVVMNTDNPNDFTDNLNKSLTVSVSCYKIFIAWLSYKNIAALINYLTEEPFKPLDLGEMKIRKQYDKIIRNNTLRYTILIVTSWTSLILTSLLTDFRHRKLTYRGWIPYDYSSYATFCFTFARMVNTRFTQIIGLQFMASTMSLQLTNSIFQMEWPIVENSVKKSILIIMKRAMTPIEISTIYILNINLDSFVVLLKTSYSVYNVLLQVPE
ncbi:uncharacterized protein [Temnothorax longispinosus]|uniref:uncharacterized protein isoform X4 n=1 Tax=Temnothorax longispinosus TaxID=300112 RepID=UPI003A98E6A7